MKLDSLSYNERIDDPRFWSLDEFHVHDFNLLVGMNASGKTRTLNVINGLATLLQGTRTIFGEGSYVARFVSPDCQDDPLVYRLTINDSIVEEESLMSGRRHLLKRRASGKGRIEAKRLKRKIDFSVPTGQLAVVAKRDSLQHPFLEGIYEWSTSVRYYRCCTLMGKTNMLAVGENANFNGITANVDHPVQTFLSGCERFGKRNFKNPILKDLREMGYPLKDITADPPNSMQISGSQGRMMCLHAHERDLECSTDQHSMSEGMFRSLTLLMHLNYCMLENPYCCVLIDDIGEGLDYERAQTLVRIIREKAVTTPMQVVMTTNSRFVMNNVPLEDWQIIDRKGQKVQFHNLDNSRKAFEDFELTGLSNFDFFRSGSAVE